VSRTLSKQLLLADPPAASARDRRPRTTHIRSSRRHLGSLSGTRSREWCACRKPHPAGRWSRIGRDPPERPPSKTMRARVHPSPHC